MTGALLVAGTTSDAGKSTLVAGLCRWLARAGVAVAPFKGQNMALNATVTPGGGEIAWAQAAQARAAGVVPEVAMNPVLLKPTGERSSQVVVMGHAREILDAAAFPERKAALLPTVLGALQDLRRRFDVVVCEGAGGIAEINLRAGDLANLGLARGAGLPVVVIADIERGGVFASLYGSLALLGPEDQAHLHGFIINRFRGDPALLRPGIDELERRTGRPVLGVVPWVRGLPLDMEDSLALQRAPGLAPPRPGSEILSVAVVTLPRIGNFTDIEPLMAEPGVRVVFTESPEAVAAADLAVLPGSKTTVEDLAWLRARGLADAVLERAAAGRPVLGICAGYQMLGRHIVDPVESRAGAVEGLGLLPVDWVFEEPKVLARTRGVAPGFGDVPVDGYEVHYGRPNRLGAAPLFASPPGEDASPEGCSDGAVSGTSLHGLFESDPFRRAFLASVARETGRHWLPGDEPFAAARERHDDRLAALVQEHLDTAALTAIIHGPAVSGLPIVESGLRAWA